jgi:hypothetical protein
MSEQPTSRILLNNTKVRGHGYVELLDDGRVKAGYFKDTAKLYGSADEAHARFRESYDFSGNLSSWNISECLQDYIAQRDDGR